MNQDELKQAVAQAAIDYIAPLLHSDMVIGIGTGSTANYFIDQLGQYQSQFKGAVASSEASAARLKKHGISVFVLNTVEQFEFYIDGADEITPQLHMIKGGGAALTREKIVAAHAQKFICIADESKWVETLGRFPLPIEVVPMAREHVCRELVKLGAHPVYRESVVTDNGGHIIDAHDLTITDAIALERTLNQITGVMTNGLFAEKPADILLLGRENGVETHTPIS